ncbi:conjugal transfer protein TraB, partial [Vibrio parahaemolyticus]
SYSQKAPEVEEKDNKDDESIYLPSGSILTGVLINGMDAPTSQGARRDPFPSTLRIQKEAILPNRFRADVRECFLIVSGYGDLSSERAYLRGETFSCVRDDGGVIEAKLDSYAVGE